MRLNWHSLMIRAALVIVLTPFWAFIAIVAGVPEHWQLVSYPILGLLIAISLSPMYPLFTSERWTHLAFIERDDDGEVGCRMTIKTNAPPPVIDQVIAAYVAEGWEQVT